MIIINENTYSEPLWLVTIGTGVMETQQFKVYAPNAQDAVDLVVDYMDEHEEFEGLIFDYYALYDECQVDETVDEYAEANGMVSAGNHGFYVQLINIEEVTE